MKHYFRTIAALTASLMGSALIPALQADDWNKKTVITIDQSIDVQGTVLPPGSYVMKILDLPADRFAVQISNANDNHLITTVLAIPAYRREVTGNSDFKFQAVSDGKPRKLHTWFYPGDNFGVEFRFGRTDAAVEASRQQTPAPSVTTGGN
jgi:hypothetical protein